MPLLSRINALPPPANLNRRANNMNEKLKQRAEAWQGNFITIDTGKISNREMLEAAEKVRWQPKI